eukprot:Skav208115  [mRNA]  locus=scaffold2016:49740:50162:- [translate_table: standard]
MAIIVLGNKGAVTISIVCKHPLVPGGFSALAGVNLLGCCARVETLHAPISSTCHPTNGIGLHGGSTVNCGCGGGSSAAAATPAALSSDGGLQLELCCVSSMGPFEQGLLMVQHVFDLFTMLLGFVVLQLFVRCNFIMLLI